MSGTAQTNNLLSHSNSLPVSRPMPRARQHITSLLARHASLAESISSLEASISQSTRELDPSYSAGSNGSTSGDGSVLGDVRREEMEILALEEMMAEFETKVRTLTPALNT